MSHNCIFQVWKEHKTGCCSKMVTNQEKQYELAIENFSFMTFHTRALSIFCNQTKADTRLQCMLKCSNFCKWWEERNYVEYLSLSNIYCQYREILPVHFSKLLNCSFKRSFWRPSSPLPHQLPQGAETTSLCLFITNQCEPSLSMELSFSLPPSASLLFTHFILLLKISC